MPYPRFSTVVLRLLLCAAATPACDPEVPNDDGIVSDPAACPPAEIVEQVGSVEGLAADELGAFWLDQGVLFGVRDHTSTPEPLGSFGSDGPTSTGNRLTAAGPHVLVAGSYGTFRVSKDGSSVLELLAGNADAHAVATTSTDLFIGRLSSLGANLVRIPLDGSDAEILLDGGWLYDLEVDGDDVYWSDSGTSSDTHQHSARLGRFGAAGNVVLADGLLADPMGIALDESHLYWADYSGGAILRMPKTGGQSVAIVQIHLPRDVAVAPEGLYVTHDHVRGLTFVPTGSTQPECLATLPDRASGHPSQVALTDEFVYVQTIVPGEYHGTVVRTPRRATE